MLGFFIVQIEFLKDAFENTNCGLLAFFLPSGLKDGLVSGLDDNFLSRIVYLLLIMLRQ